MSNPTWASTSIPLRIAGVLVFMVMPALFALQVHLLAKLYSWGLQDLAYPPLMHLLHAFSEAIAWPSIAWATLVWSLMGVAGLALLAYTKPKELLCD